MTTTVPAALPRTHAALQIAAVTAASPSIKQSLIVGPAVLARIVVGADGEPSSIPTLGAEGAQIDLNQYDAAYPHRAPHRVAALVEDGAAAPALLAAAAQAPAQATASTQYSPQCQHPSPYGSAGELLRSNAITWPVSRDVGRIGDMSPSAHLRVGLDSDNDVYVSVHDEKGGGSVEFCTGGGGGGRSMHTRLALIELMNAMEQDNAEGPDFDWWARRNGAASRKEGGAA